MDETTKNMVTAQLKSAIFALPSFGLVETSNSVGKDRRKLVRGKGGLADVLVESGRLLQCAALLLLWIKDANAFPVLADAQAHRGCEVAVAGDENRAVEEIICGVNEHVRGDVDVGAFLFCLHDIDERRNALGLMSSVHRHDMGEIPPVDELDAERHEGAEVHVLSERLFRVVFARADAGGEVFDREDVLVVAYEGRGQSADVEPFVRGVTKCPMIEVESVYVDVCSFLRHCFDSVKSRSQLPKELAPRPFGEPSRGVLWPHYTTIGADLSITRRNG